MKEESAHVFVYGTLMEGYGNYRHFLEGKAALVGHGTLEGVLYHLPAGYPALLEKEGIVKGQVFEIDEPGTLDSLDSLEGYQEGSPDNLYERVRRVVALDEGVPIECWVYVYLDGISAQARGTLVPGGDWNAFMNGRAAWSGLNARDCLSW